MMADEVNQQNEEVSSVDSGIDSDGVVTSADITSYFESQKGSAGAEEVPDSGTESDVDSQRDGDSTQADDNTPADTDAASAATDTQSQSQQGVTDGMVNMAGYFGVSPEDARSFKSDAELQRSLNMLAKSKMAQQQQGGGEAEQKPQPLFEPLPVPDLGDEYDDTIKDVFKQMTEGFNAQMSKMAEKVQNASGYVEQTRSRMQQAELEAEFGEFEKGIAEMGDAYKPFLGSGETRSMDQNTPEFKKRAEVVVVYDKLKLAMPGIEPRRLAKMAVNALLADQVVSTTKETAKTELKNQIRNRQGQFTSHASTRENGAAADPTKRAIEAVRAKLAEMGD